MSYYIGFRFGWVRVGSRAIGWHDAAVYPYSGGRAAFGSWKVWVK